VTGAIQLVSVSVAPSPIFRFPSATPAAIFPRPRFSNGPCRRDIRIARALLVDLEKIQEHAAIDRDRLARDLKEMGKWPVSEV